MSEVNKDVSGNEEKVLLNNIMSLVQQLLQNESTEAQGGEMQTGAELDTKQDVSMAENEMSKEDKKEDEKENEVKKSTIDTPSDGSDANDDAEKKIEEPLSNITEETIDEVAKAILNKIGFKQGVKKSAVKNESSTSNVLNELVKINKSLLARQEEMEKGMSNLFKGLGIADEIEKSYKTEQNREVKKGLNNPADQAATLAYIAKALGVSKEANDEDKSSSNMDKVRKSLANSGLLSALVVKK